MDSQLFDLDTVQEGAHTWPSDTWLQARRKQLRQEQEARDEADNG